MCFLPPSTLKDIWGAFPHPGPCAKREQAWPHQEASLHIKQTKNCYRAPLLLSDQPAQLIEHNWKYTCSKHCCVFMWRIWTSKQLNEEHSWPKHWDCGCQSPKSTRCRQTQGDQRYGFAVATVKRTHLLPLFPKQNKQNKKQTIGLSLG